jgi:Helix-turn-helix
MVRLVSGERISGRPDREEQEFLAAGVGAALRALRREHGLSIRDLERQSGVTRVMISYLERGLRRPRASVLGWLAWGLVGPDRAEGVKAALCNAAGTALVAESRWSERSHARRAWRQLQAGALQPPGWMIAPYAVAVLGEVMPDRIGELRQVQDRARSADAPCPEPGGLSAEALLLADEFDRATPYELRKIGQAMAAEDKAAKKRAARKRNREVRARLGLTGTDTRRPVGIPAGIPESDREVYEMAIALRRMSPRPVRRR